MERLPLEPEFSDLPSDDLPPDEVGSVIKESPPSAPPKPIPDKPTIPPSGLDKLDGYSDPDSWF